MACKAYLANLPADAERLVGAASPATTGFVTFGRERAHEAIAVLRHELTNRQADQPTGTDPALSG